MSRIIADINKYSKNIAKFLKFHGYKANFTLESLKEVDRFFAENSANGKPTENGLLAEATGSKIFAVGAYVGEVIRKSCSGAWEGDDADPKVEINIALRLWDNSIIWPTQKAFKRLTNGEEDSLYTYAYVITSEYPKDNQVGSLDDKKPFGAVLRKLFRR
jgi:hypothetical protein